MEVAIAFFVGTLVGGVAGAVFVALLIGTRDDFNRYHG